MMSCAMKESYIISREECCAWFSSARYDSIISPGSNRSRGSVILYRNSFSLQNHWSDTEGRLVLAEFAIRELSFRVLCVYAPNRFIARNDFLEGCADIFLSEALLFKSRFQILLVNRVTTFC